MIKESSVSLNATVKAYCRKIRSSSSNIKAKYLKDKIYGLLKYYARRYISDDLYDHYRNMVSAAMVEGGFRGSDQSFAFGLHVSRTYKPIFKENNYEENLISNL